MSEKDRLTEEMNEKLPVEATENENTPAPDIEEEHGHANYRFAFKVIAVLVAIILIIVILKATGVPVAVRDWFKSGTAACIFANFPQLF